MPVTILPETYHVLSQAADNAAPATKAKFRP